MIKINHSSTVVYLSTTHPDKISKSFIQNLGVKFWFSLHQHKVIEPRISTSKPKKAKTRKMNYKFVLKSVVMLGIIMVIPTQGKNSTEDTCRNETYSPRPSITFKCSDPAYCSTLLRGRTKPDNLFNSNCKRFCPGCFQAIKDLVASKKLQTQPPIPDPTSPPVTEPTTTEPIPDIKNENTTGPSQGNSSPGNHVWTAIITSIFVIAFVCVVGVCFRKKIKSECVRLRHVCSINHSSSDQHYTSVKMDENEPNLEVPPEIQDRTVQPQVTTHIIQNCTTSNGCAKPKCTSVVIDERRIEAAYGDQQRAASDMATHITQNGLIPNGTASRMEPALHSVQNATASEMDATNGLIPNGTASRLEPALHSVQNANASETNATPQMGAMPQSSTQQAAPNESGPQVGNIPQAPPNRAGASPPNDVPRMEANPQVVTNSNPTGGSTTQQSTGAGGQNQSTIININLLPLQPEPAPTTNVKPKENLRFPVQEKGKGAEPKTSKEARDEEGGPHKFSPPD